MAIAAALTAALLYFLGFFNPCRKGHIFIGNEKEHTCTRCSLVEEHCYVEEGDHCVCDVCGLSTQKHNLVSKGKNLVCANCGFSIAKIEALKKFLKENGVRNRGMYCIDETLDETTHIIGYDEEDNSLEFFYRSISSWETRVIVTLFFDTGKCECSDYEYFNLLSSAGLEGHFSAASYKSGDKITVTKTTGYASDASAKNKFRDLFYSQVGNCLERNQALLDKLDFPISLSDIGFDQLT